jgi:glycolate oxidase iron-sulfur subunit
VLRKCVHCGFCNATCPTYQLLGDELDGPRGRIYLVQADARRRGADREDAAAPRPLPDCRACETTCPSGVQYGSSRHRPRHRRAESRARSLGPPAARRAGAVLAEDGIVFLPIGIGRAFKVFLPGSLRKRFPRKAIRASGLRRATPGKCSSWRAACSLRSRRASTPPRRGCSTGPASRSPRRPARAACGALRFHLDDQDAGRADARALIDAWWPQVERGEVEAIVVTASGCGSFVKEYAHL